MVASCTRPPEHEIYIYGTIAVVLVSVLSLVGIVIVPFRKHKAYQYALLFFMSLAIGCLTGDAILHLIPEALSLHGHSNCQKALVVDNHTQNASLSALPAMTGGNMSHPVHSSDEDSLEEHPDQHHHQGESREEIDKSHESGHEDGKEHDHDHDHDHDHEHDQGHDHDHDHEQGHDHDHEHAHDHSYMWKMVVVLASMYAFFIFEAAAHSVAHMTVCHAEPELQSLVSFGSFRYRSPNKSKIYADNSIVTSPQRVATSINGRLEHDTTSFWAQTSPPPYRASPVEFVMNDRKVDSPSEHKKAEKLICGLKPIAFMILFSDGIHNFCDGLAMGAAFTNGINSGLTTSLAVLCHELPHELGDFAVLLNSGLSYKKALLFNFFSAITAVAGLYVGIALGQLESVQLWLFAAIAGMFLYIALVDMMHEVREIETSNKVLAAILQNLGILIGIAILLVLAIFEESFQKVVF